MRARVGVATWVLFVAVSAAVMALSVRGPVARLVWQAPLPLFILVVTAASGCVVAALWLVIVGFRDDHAELGLLGGMLWVVSVLPLVHGLTVPGVLYGANSVVATSVFLASPIGLTVGLPLLAPGTALARWIAHRWRYWVMTWIVATAALAAAMLATPEAWPAPSEHPVVIIAVVAPSLLGAFVLSWRHLWLYRVGQRTASLVASIGFAHIGLSNLVWIVAHVYSLGWWYAHILDISGVFAAIFGLGVAGRTLKPVRAVLEPVVNRDPLVAFELGLTPTLHRFVAALETKDLVTRDHVVRTAELAMRMGLRAGLPPDRVRRLGLAGLLHDIGKLEVPDEILTKPSSLTDAEYERIKQHTVAGARLAASEPALSGIAPLVRWHHERVDGRGYPDGLTGDQIPLEVAIIAVCDAWDAITYGRHYRSALTSAEALAILSEHAGSQFDPLAVALLRAELAEDDGVQSPVFDAVGRSAPTAAVCADAMPVGVTGASLEERS